MGYLLAWGLYGVLAVQVCGYSDQSNWDKVEFLKIIITDIYFLAFPRDRAIHKWLVAIVFLLETIQVVVIARDMFDAFAKGFGNPDAITGLHLDGLSAPIIAGFGASLLRANILCFANPKTVGLLVQLFYAYRIKILSHSNVVPLLICFVCDSRRLSVRFRSLTKESAVGLYSMYRCLHFWDSRFHREGCQEIGYHGRPGWSWGRCSQIPDS